MRLKYLALMLLLIALGALTLAPSIYALPTGVNGDFDCDDCHFITPTPSATEGVVDTMFAAPVDDEDTPTLNGKVDAIWGEANAISIPVDYGWAGTTTVTMKALYTEDRIFFLAQWEDPSLSDRRQPWRKTADTGVGTWKHIPGKPQSESSLTDNGWFFGTPPQLRLLPPAEAACEDGFAMIWGARDETATVGNVANFKEVGCAIMCHVTPGEGTSNDYKYTHTTGEVADMWHWKLIRTGTVGFVDDQYVNADRPSTDTPEAGRHSDPGQAYVNNEATTTIAGTETPTFTGPNQPVTTGTPDALDPYFIPFAQAETVTASTLSAVDVGEEIAGILVRNLTGDRGDIAAQTETTASAGYNPANDTWTLEFSRALTTSSQLDVQFDDLQDTYYFGVSVFDNAQIEHSFHKGAYALEFLPAVEITFPDIAGHWAQREIEDFASAGNVVGYPNGLFMPDNPVTRAEFVKMVMEALDIPQVTTPTTTTFSDVGPTDWFFGYVEGAAAADFVKGYGDGTFRPDVPIDRQEAAKVLVFALGLDDEAFARSPSAIQDILAELDDTGIIELWAVPIMAEAVEQEIFIGYPDDTLRPLATITRAETVATIHRSAF